jgi:hypothetical protein
MDSTILQHKTGRYLAGAAMPAEKRQIQTWLSCTDNLEQQLTPQEKKTIEEEILAEIKAYTAYPLLYPKEKPWWTKITSIF